MKSCSVKFLSVALLFMLSIAAHSNSTGVSIDGFAYSAYWGTISITGYSGVWGAVSIPSTIPGVFGTVTGVADHAFDSSKGLTSVTIPSSVTSIGSLAFQGCTNLLNVTFSDGVTVIGNSSFQNCTALTSVTIPSSVRRISDAAFYGCTGITSFIVSDSNSFYSSNADGVLFDKSQATLIQYPSGTVGGYTIPSSVATIGIYAFSCCTGLTNVTIPNSVTSIADSAFQNCTGLTSVTIPNSVTSVGGCFFQNCTGLTSVTIPNSVTSIGPYAFYGCNHLVSVTIPRSVTSIEGSMFQSCTGLTHVTIPSSVTSIGGYAFQGCVSLTNVKMPVNLIGIGDSAFYGCTNLTSVTIPSSVNSIGTCAFFGCTRLKSAYFIGNIPAIDSSAFPSSTSGFTVYYFDGSTGFTSPTWDGWTSVDIGAYSPAPAWLLLNGFAYNANLKNIPNNDGVPLLMDYALNLDPTQKQDSSMPQPAISGDQMSLAYYAGSAGVTYSVEVSSDLQTWTPSGVTTSVPDTNNFCTATFPLSGARQFMRLSVSY